MKTKSKIITRENNIIDINEKPYKTKKEIGKVPEPTGFRIVLFPLLLEKKTKDTMFSILDRAGREQRMTTLILKTASRKYCKILCGPSKAGMIQLWPVGPM